MRNPRAPPNRLRLLLGTVNWTVDAPVDVLPELPPLPADLRARLDEALARPAAQQPEWPDPTDVAHVRTVLESVPPVTLPPEVDRLQRAAGRRRRGRGVPAAGRRLRGDVRRQHRAAHPGDDPHAAADGRRADLRREHAGGQGRPDRRPVRQAAQRRRSTRWACRPTAATSSTRWSPTPPPGSPTPTRMVRAYANAGAAMNLVRALTGTGMADLSLVHDWNKDFVRTSAAGERYEAVAAEIDRGGAVHGRLRGRRPQPAQRRVLRQPRGAAARLRAGDAAPGHPRDEPRLYDLSAHFLWIGERTRQLDGAHIAFAELLANPIGLKIGPTTTPELAVEYVERLDPRNQPGRLTLISRMGNGKVRDVLPPIVEKVEASGHKVIWQCDPMHGNTHESPTGYKTRHFDRIVDEVQGFFEVHAALGTPPGRHPRRAHRRGRHRVPRRRPGDLRRRPGRPLRDGLRPAAEHPAVAGAGVPRRGDAARLITGRPGRFRRRAG